MFKKQTNHAPEDAWCYDKEEIVSNQKFVFFFGALFFAVLVPTHVLALNITCEQANEVLDECHITIPERPGRDCNTCCNMNFGGEGETQEEREAFVADCVTICESNSTEGCIETGGGGGSGGGGTDVTVEEVDAQSPRCENNGIDCACKVMSSIMYNKPANNIEAFFVEKCNGTRLLNYENIAQHSILQTGCLNQSSTDLDIIEYETDDLCSGYATHIGSVKSCNKCDEDNGYIRFLISDVLKLTYDTDYQTVDYNNWPCRVNDSWTGQDIYVCVKCKTSTTWDGNWVNDSSDSRYQMQRGIKKSCGISNDVYMYRCAAGYYSKNGLTTATNKSDLGCTACPKTYGNYPTAPITGTTNGGNTAVENCYIKTGTYSDSTGTFVISNMCYYNPNSTSNNM